jgi:hypothetical protein
MTVHDRPCQLPPQRREREYGFPEHVPEDLESVLGATPHESESRILRHAPRGTQNHVSAGQSMVLAIRGTNKGLAGRNRDRPTLCLRVSTRVSTVLSGRHWRLGSALVRVVILAVWFG